MKTRIGSFNLNNLFSRWNYKGELAKDERGRGWHLDKNGETWTRRFNGGVIGPKTPEEREKLGKRILGAELDVVAVQEVEDRDTLREFNEQHLRGRFTEVVLVEGNDQRLIDVGLLSRFPVGEVRSYQCWRHPEMPGEPIFRRDLLLAEILSPDRRLMFWVGVVHLKSQLVDWRIKDEKERAQAAETAARIRRFEAESIAEIVRKHLGPAEPFFLCGDLNDVPESRALTPLLGFGRGCLGLVNLLAARQPSKSARWTTSHKAAGEERRFMQYDYILAPPFVAEVVPHAWVERRASELGERDGSDHELVVAEMELKG